MFGKRKEHAHAGITLIASNCEMAGDVHFSDQLQVNGVIKGNLYADDGSKATVTVSEKGRIEGNIRVPNVVVNGKVDGDIHSSRHIELAAKAEVTGNVYYNLMEMVMGSKIQGELVKVGDGKSAEPDTAVDESSPGEAKKESDSQVAPANSGTA